jgi:hypothetical protein
MHSRLLNETTRLVSEVRATLAAELAKSEPAERVVNDALRGLVRFEVIPAMEADLAAEHQKPLPDRAAIEALRQEILGLHSRNLPDHVRDSLLASVAEPVSEPTE